MKNKGKADDDTRARALAEWDGEGILERFEAELAARVSPKRGTDQTRGRAAG